MKELSIEERAQRYDEAIERAKKWYNAPNVDKIPTFGNRVIEEIFPELIKNNDEKIRGAIIHFISHTPTVPKGRIDKKTMLAWLEKQNLIMAKSPQLGEQKPADRVKPMFKVGDWIIYDRHMSKVKDMDSEGYLVEDTYGDEGILPKEFAEKHYHLWTIAEAKEGDVLVSRSPFIYGKQCPYGGLNWCDNKFIKASNFIFTDSPVHPATKEQREQLEKAMADAGWEFDFEKKELKKISQRMISAEAKEAMYGKPAWSEEDDDNMMMIEDRLRDYLDYIREDSTLKKHIKNSLKEEVSEYIDWLKSLKDRVQPQNQWKPSDEQMDTLRHVISGCSYDIEPLVEMEEQLKKLRGE